MSSAFAAGLGLVLISHELILYLSLFNPWLTTLPHNPAAPVLKLF